MNNKSNDLGRIIKQQRILIPLTLKELANISGVSDSHLGRIERGERFPSARILRKIAKPLGFGEEELLRLAGFLSPVKAGEETKETASGHLDPVVAKMLAEESPETQRAVVGILSILKSIAKGIAKENR